MGSSLGTKREPRIALRSLSHDFLAIAVLILGVGGCRTAAAAKLIVPATDELISCVQEARQLPSDSVWRSAGAESALLAISRSVPGGLTSLERESDSSLTLQLKDSTRVSVVRDAVFSVYARQMTDTERALFARQLAASHTRQVSWSYAELVDWSSYLMGILSGAPGHGAAGFLGTGADVHHDRVVVAVTNEIGPAWVNEVLSRAHSR
jgi:hypothetical protein